jgi:hypothetical protein
MVEEISINPGVPFRLMLRERNDNLKAELPGDYWFSIFESKGRPSFTYISKSQRRPE